MHRSGAGASILRLGYGDPHIILGRAKRGALLLKHNAKKQGVPFGTPCEFWRYSVGSEIAANTDDEIAAHQVFANRDVDATRVSARSNDIRGDGIEGILHVEICRHGRAVVQAD